MEDDRVIAKARQLLVQREAEAAHLRSFIETYDEIAGYSSASTGFIAVPPTTATSHENILARAKVSMTETVAATIIRETGRPVPSVEMLRLLTERGVSVGGKVPLSTLAARLSRAQSLQFERGLGWAFAPVPRDEAADPAPSGESAASVPETPHDAERRGEVVDNNIAT